MKGPQSQNILNIQPLYEDLHQETAYYSHVGVTITSFVLEYHFCLYHFSTLLSILAATHANETIYVTLHAFFSSPLHLKGNQRFFGSLPEVLPMMADPFPKAPALAELRIIKL